MGAFQPDRDEPFIRYLRIAYWHGCRALLLVGECASLVKSGCERQAASPETCRLRGAAVQPSGRFYATHAAPLS